MFSTLAEEKKTGKCGNFSQVGDPPPLPPVWEPHVCEKKIMGYFAGFCGKNCHFIPDGYTLNTDIHYSEKKDYGSAPQTTRC